MVSDPSSSPSVPNVSESAPEGTPDGQGQPADPRFPIGEHDFRVAVTQAAIDDAREAIRRLPEDLAAALEGLDSEQLDTPYRDGGWTVRQVVHHLADSHLNSHCRFRLALTEDVPEIRPYDEKLWAELDDARSGPLEPSLAILEGVHRRWSALLDSLEPADYDQRLFHPEIGEELSLAQMTVGYGWHGRHHIAHITTLRQQKGWNG